MNEKVSELDDKVRHLLEAVCEATNWPYKIERILEAVSPPDPGWGVGGRVHNWRNYVPDIAQELWPTLGIESKLLVYMMAEKQASEERWD